MKFNYLTHSHLLLSWILIPLVTISVHAAHHGNIDPTGTFTGELEQ